MAQAVEADLKALMILSLDGDAAAYAALLSGLSGYLRAYFRRRLGAGVADLEDLVQDTLLAIHLKRGSYDRGQPFTPWVYAMARYKLLDHFRKTGARRHVPIEDAGALFATESADEGVVRRDLAKLLASLPARQRNLITDVKLEGLSLQETAERRGVSVVAAKVAIHRALKVLSRKVADEDR